LVTSHTLISTHPIVGSRRALRVLADPLALRAVFLQAGANALRDAS
jgi:hypothetical protein